ncbi:hypothetical protein RFI_03249, partial [Reticulomyxa filosa]
MNNNNPLPVLKPIQRLGFVFGDFNIQGSKPDHLELKQVVQKNNEFDIRGNEELIFTYGLANNEIVLVVSIDGNISDSLPVEEKKYSDDNKQDVWSEQYNRNCTTRIFLSSRQTLNKNKKATQELQGKMTLAALSEQKHLMVLYERARQLIHVYKWNERIVDSLQKLKNKTINLRERVLPDGFHVTSMCFDNKDDSLYILDNTSTILCITLDAGLFDHTRKIICKEQYFKVMILEGGYIVGIKSYEQKEKGQNEQVSTAQVSIQLEHNNDVVTEGNMQTSGEIHSDNNKPGNTNVDTKESAVMSTTDITTIPLVKCTPTGLIQCDFYVLDDSKELVRSLVLPKEFTSNGINGIQFKLVLQKQIYVVFLDDQFVFHCLPLQVSLKKSQLHIKLISMYGNLTTSDDQKFRTKKPSKLDYIEYSLDKFGSKPEFYSQPKLALHLSVLLDANENKSSSWISRERIAQASELVLHTCDKVNHDTKKIFTHLDWKCTPIVTGDTNKQIHLKDVLKLVKNHSPSRSGDDFIRQVIVQFPMQIARASGGDFVLLHNGENDQARYAHCTTNSSFVECIRFGGKIRVMSSMGKQSTGKSYMLNHLFGCKFDISG